MAPSARQKRRGKGAQAPGVSSAKPEPPIVARLLLTLREIDQIEDPDERRRCMLDRFEETKGLARNRSYVNKRGNEVVTSDHVAMTRIDEIMLDVLGIQPAKPGTRRVPDLSVFNGGKAADRKIG